MAIASIIISALAVIAASCSLYWARQARKARRDIDKIRAQRESSSVLHVEGFLTPEAERKLRDEFTGYLRSQTQRKR
jgi:hypothetical protein